MKTSMEKSSERAESAEADLKGEISEMKGGMAEMVMMMN